MKTQIKATAVGTITLLPNGLKRGRKTKSNRPTKARTTICRPLKTTLNNLRLGDPKKNETCVNTLTSKTTVVVRWIQVRRRVGDRPREHIAKGVKGGRGWQKQIATVYIPETFYSNSTTEAVPMKGYRIPSHDSRTHSLFSTTSSTLKNMVFSSALIQSLGGSKLSPHLVRVTFLFSPFCSRLMLTFFFSLFFSFLFIRSHLERF